MYLVLNGVFDVSHEPLESLQAFMFNEAAVLTSKYATISPEYKDEEQMEIKSHIGQNSFK